MIGEVEEVGVGSLLIDPPLQSEEAFGVWEVEEAGVGKILTNSPFHSEEPFAVRKVEDVGVGNLLKGQLLLLVLFSIVEGVDQVGV